jgi:hypothetical protein
VASPEHQAIAETIDEVLGSLAGSALIGVFEGQRRTFDYSCLLRRDLGRPLVAQVLWQHDHGLEKDIRTLLLDPDSSLKLYVMRDSARVRSTLDDVLASYRNDSELKGRLRGLKIVFVPGDFDADKAEQRQWLKRHLADSFMHDISFAILFGCVTKHALEVFLAHNGPFGLKYAILDEIVKHGLIHMPGFKQRLGYKTDGPIREALAMLNASGLTRNWTSSICHFPSIRGRFILDFTRRILLDVKVGDGWSIRTAEIFNALQMPPPPYPTEPITSKNVRITDAVSNNILHAANCKAQFGRDLLGGIDLNDPQLYSDFNVSGFLDEMRHVKTFPPDFFDQPEYLFTPARSK